MLDRKQIREAIACPQLGDTTYGEWGILTVEQRLTIARLLDELEYTDGYLKRLWLENQKQKEVIDKVRNNLEKDISVIKNIKMSNKEIICRLEETTLKEEMKERCLAKGQYKDEK